MNEIAQTILRQLGGTRFIMMTGASKFVYGDNYLMFDLPSRMVKKNGQKMKITLNGSDTYKLELIKLIRFETKILDSSDHIYADNLGRVFTRITGLETSLGA